MPRPRATTAHLGSSFSVRSAHAAGVGAGTLRHARFEAPYVGVRSVTVPEQGELSLPERVLRSASQLLPRLRPGEAFSHETALLAYGCPIWVPEEVHVTAQHVHTRTRVTGVRGHRFSAPATTKWLRGLPLVLPVTALLQAAGSLSLKELVVAIDHLTRASGKGGCRPALVDTEDLRSNVASFRGRGAATLRQAIQLATARNESRMESLTWLLLVAFSLEGDFELQVDINDERGWIGRFDFVNRKLKLIVEYDGEQHRTDRDQYARDLQRLDRARQAGYIVIRLLAEDLLRRPHEAAGRIARELRVEPVLRPEFSSFLGP